MSCCIAMMEMDTIWPVTVSIVTHDMQEETTKWLCLYYDLLIRKISYHSYCCNASSCSVVRLCNSEQDPWWHVADSSWKGEDGMFHLQVIFGGLMDLASCMSNIVYGFSCKCYCRNLHFYKFIVI